MRRAQSLAEQAILSIADKSAGSRGAEEVLSEKTFGMSPCSDKLYKKRPL